MDSQKPDNEIAVVMQHFAELDRELLEALEKQ